MWARRNRRSAFADTGSRSSIGLVSGGASFTASAGPGAQPDLAEVGVGGRRSHSRPLIAIDHSAAGSGPFQSSAARCLPAARLTLARVWDR